MQPSDITLYTSYPATIKGRQDIEVRPKVSEFITKINISDGAVVKKGQVLFQLDRVQYEEAVRAAEANVKVAEASLKNSQLTVNTKKSLADQNIISQFELETAQYDLNSQEALLAQAQAQLVSAQNDLSYTNITSPWDGIVGDIPYDVGSLVSTTINPPLTVISDISDMYVYFSMNEKQLLELTRKDSIVQQTLDSMPDV
ncbi:MAG: efflux RND transporter periplasmic adaptor subunit [Odoribacter sp.]|nr:efflux RND transporter periplasmic adaptor subunit [Odoribacter sp.]